MTYSPHNLPSYGDFAVDAGESRQIYDFDHCT
jgi:hypothetical protein